MTTPRPTVRMIAKWLRGQHGWCDFAADALLGSNLPLDAPYYPEPQKFMAPHPQSAVGDYTWNHPKGDWEVKEIDGAKQGDVSHEIIWFSVDQVIPTDGFILVGPTNTDGVPEVWAAETLRLARSKQQAELGWDYLIEAANLVRFWARVPPYPTGGAAHQPPEPKPAPDHAALVADKRAVDLARETLAGHPYGNGLPDLTLAWLASRAELHAAAVLRLADALASAPLGEVGEDAQPYKDALHDLVMLKAQDDISCVPAPTKDQWAKAWDEATELTRVEP